MKGTQVRYKAIRPIQTKIVAQTAEVVDGGSDYADGDKLKLAGGRGLAACLTITSISSVVRRGEITAVKIDKGGAYAVFPAHPVQVVGGSGSGATFNVLWKGRCVNVEPGHPIPEDSEMSNPDALIRTGLIAQVAEPKKK